MRAKRVLITAELFLEFLKPYLDEYISHKLKE